MVFAAAVGVRFASAGVAEIEAVDDARAAAAEAVGAHPSAIHSQGLHS